jgi:hypothetical protein
VPVETRACRDGGELPGIDFEKVDETKQLRCRRTGGTWSAVGHSRSKDICVDRRLKRRNTSRIFSKLWLPVVVLVVIAIVSYGVNTVRHESEAITNPPVKSSIPATVVQINPKNVTYEVFGTLGSGGKVTYADLDSQPIEVTLASLPWSHSETTMASSATLSLVAQVDGSSVGCRIIVNGQVRDEQSVSHEGAAVACTVTAA